MKLIVATSPTFFVEEDKILTALFEEGLDLLHIRKPNTQSVYLERLLRLIPKKYYNRIVLHDHFQLQKDFGLKGIHLNERNNQEPKNFSGNKSCSCHTLKELEDMKSAYDYVFMCPIFNNINDGPTYPIYKTKEIEEAKKNNFIDSKVMALGGIDATNISLLKKYGFGGAVGIGSAGVSAVPMAARVSQKVGQEYDPGNFLLMHAMGPNVAGVIGSAVAAGVLISILG